MILAPNGNSGKLGRQIAEDLHLKLAVLTDSESSCSSDGEFAPDSGEETETHECLRQVIINISAYSQATTKQLRSVSNVIKNLENELHRSQTQTNVWRSNYNQLKEQMKVTSPLE